FTPGAISAIWSLPTTAPIAQLVVGSSSLERSATGRRDEPLRIIFDRQIGGCLWPISAWPRKRTFRLCPVYEYAPPAPHLHKLAKARRALLAPQETGVRPVNMLRASALFRPSACMLSL